MGNSRMSMGGASLHGNSRKSIQPRMSSVSTASRLPDPRNIGEKQFMNTSIRQLIDYLMRHGFDGAVSPKILSKPTNKDFTQIILFLFRQFDPNYKFTGKFEDEMIGMFKYLGYPFTIAKSNISAVGSPHAWPTLLGCIMWLIDLLNYSEVSNSAMQESEMDADSDPSASEKGFYRYLSKAYEMFLSGKDEQYAHLEEQFISSFDNKNVLIKDQIEALEKRNQALSAEIEQIKNRSEYMPELVNKKREFQQNFAQFSSLMDELKRHRDQLKEKNEQRETEIGSLSSSIAALHEEIDSLHLRIQTQDLSPEDVKNMVTERQRLEEAYQQAAENRHALQRSIKDLEASLRAKVLSLEDSVRIYTGFAEGLKLVPASARNARGQELGIEIDIRAKKREGLLKTDIRNDVLPVLQQMRVELNETTLSIRAEMMQEQEAAEEIEGQMIELKESTVDLDAKLRRAEATYRREKEMLDQSASLHSKEMDAMEGRLVQLRDTAADEAKITAARRRLAENSSIRAARKTEHERKKTAMVESVMETVSQCAMHREHVQAEMEALKEAYSDRLQMFLSSAQPFQSENYADVSRDILNGSVSVAGEEQLFLSQYMPQSAQQADSSALAAGASFSHVTRRRTSARAEEEEEVVAGLDSSALSGADDADLSAEQMDQTGRDKTPEASMGSLQYMDIYPQDSAFKNHVS
jgi:kinetochore protein NDC80